MYSIVNILIINDTNVFQFLREREKKFERNKKNRGVLHFL